MKMLQIFLFGLVRITHPGRSVTTKVAAGGQGLLAYLLLKRERTHPRELLAGMFWGDRSQKQARRCLNTALWRLRRVLEPEGTPRGLYLHTTPTGEVGFNQESNHWLDVAVFEAQIHGTLTRSISEIDSEDIQKLENALELYTDDLLEGLYDDWALRERERLRRLYLNCLAYLMRYYKHHLAFEKSLRYGHQILDKDPLREEIHREIMHLYLEHGQRARALQQYERCTEILATELGIPPMAETQALYDQIVTRASFAPRTAAVPPDEQTIEVQSALQQLQLAQQSFEEAGQQLRHAIQLVKQAIRPSQ